MNTPHSRRRRLLIAALVSLATLVTSTLAAPVADASVPPRSSLELQIDNAVRSLINSERAAHHLAGLSMSSQLMLSAREHNVAMAHYNRMSHQLPGEAAWTTRISSTGYHWHYAGENIAWNSDMSENGVLALEKMMYGEQPPNDEHRVNILSSHFHDVGVDVYFDRTHHKVWLTTDFGSRT
jgi:uncharacterized protein YkwD